MASCRGSNANVVVDTRTPPPDPVFLPPSTNGSLTPKRPQYPFAAVNTRYRPKSEVLKMQYRWDMFEYVENYDDVMYQRFETGDRSETYYVFKSTEEYNAYRAGQLLHVNTYFNLPASTFSSIRDRTMPDVPYNAAGLPIWYNTPKNINPTNTLTASERAAQRADLEVYAFVSTFNDSHVLKWAFVKDEERLAYERGQRLVLSDAGTPPAV